MSHDPDSRLPRKPLRPTLLAACLLCLTAFAAPAQTTGAGNAAQNTANPSAVKPGTAGEQPPFQEYKGVRIGMSVEEARKKLGAPTDKGDTQDFYLVSDKESVQVMYDSAKKVSAIALNYMSAGGKAPSPKAVIGDDIEARPDGSLYKLVRYPKAGYWVSYSRTAGNSPIVSVMMQKMN
jgi:hypothetical protein